MKTYIIICTVVLSFIVLPGCSGSQSSVNPSLNNPKALYTPEQLRGDAEKLFTTIENVHPNISFTVSRQEYSSAKDQMLQSLTEPITRIEFYKLIAPVIAMIGDGHTSVWMPNEEFAAERNSGMLSFPFSVSYSPGKGIVISRNYTADSIVVPGKTILSVNGKNADSLFQVFKRNFAGEQERYRQKATASNFPVLLWMYGINSPFTLAFSSGSDVKNLTMVGSTVGRKKIVDLLLDISANNASYYSFSVTDDSIGYIDFRSMVYPDQFKTFLNETFGKIQKHPVKGLIVDLRKNGGGNSELGDELISYFSDKPYSMSNRKEWKMSSEYKQYLRRMYIPWYLRWFPITWVSSDARKLLGAEDGEIVVYNGDTVMHGPNPLRYSGKVVFLIGINTFSSATMTADAVKEFKLATIIGEETGGVPSSYGETYGFPLPVTRLYFSCSSALFVRASGRGDDRTGVHPDIEVKQTDDDLQRNVDTVLEFAKEWLKK